MSNYPDNFDGLAYERRNQQPHDVLPADAHAVAKAQNCYRDLVRANVIFLRSHGFTSISRGVLSDLFINLRTELEDQVHQEISNLEAVGFDMDVSGDDHDDFMDQMYSLLKQTAPRIVPVNPATRAAVGG